MDLGRDVAPETIVEGNGERARSGQWGLSALDDYRPCPSMEETIKLAQERRRHGPRIMVGGAVLTKEYADSIGADAYCRDAMASVNFAMECLNGTQE